MKRAAPDTAVRRLRMTRVAMAVLFTAVTAVCLMLLAVLALHIDATSRAGQLASNVSERAGGLARAVYFEGGTLHLEPLSEDELAQGAVDVAVLEVGSDGDGRGMLFRSGGIDRDITPDQIDGLLADVVDAQGAVSTVLPGSGGDVTWAAAPVWDGDEIAAAVLVGRSTAGEDAAHDRLALALLGGCVFLAAVAAATGYFLSGRAMRPALGALAGQEQFLAEAAHELRTPLATLRLQAEAEGGAQVMETVDRLDHLVTALLVRARVQAGTFAPETVPLRLDQLVEQVVHEYGEEREISLRIEPVVVRGDVVLIGQALRNVIDNALRYAPGAEVRVETTQDRITVDDQGPGLSEQELSEAVIAGAGSGRSLGVGLAIVTWIMDVHGGSLVLSRSALGGLRVTLEFPSYRG